MTLAEPILVVGAYGYRNVGDEAILAGLLNALAGRQVTVVSRSPADTSALHGVAAIGVLSAIPALRRHRSVLIGGGGLFGRDMGRIGRLLPLFSLLAAGFGRAIVVDGVGVEVGMSAASRFLVRRLLRVARQVTVRDQVSARLVREWGIEPLLERDLSTRMPAVSARIGRSLLRAAGVDPRRPVIGLCLTAVNHQLTPVVVAGVIDLMRRQHDVQFCFIPMSQHPYREAHNDAILARSLQATWPQMKIVEGMHHPASVLSLFGALDGVVAMRYHSLLFAERAGIPFVPIVYSAKCQAWLDERALRSVEPDGASLSEALAATLPARSKAS
jgi:polysaccharide pyruvyl transferase WcaK-like protein